MKSFQFSVFSFQFLLPIIFLVLPFIVFAHAPNIFPAGYWASEGLVSCRGARCGFDELVHTSIHVIYFGMTLAIFVAAPVLFAWGGLMILMSGANPGGLEQGKKIITGTLIGVLITLSAFLIVRTFVSFVGIEGVGGFG